MNSSKIIDHIDNKNYEELDKLLLNVSILDVLIKNNEIDIIEKIIDIIYYLSDYENIMKKLFDYIVNENKLKNRKIIKDFFHDFIYECELICDFNEEEIEKFGNYLFENKFYGVICGLRNWEKFSYINKMIFDDIIRKIINRYYEEKKFEKIKNIIDENFLWDGEFGPKCEMDDSDDESELEKYASRANINDYIKLSSTLLEENKKLKKENEELKLKMDFSDITLLEKEFNSI